MRVVDIKKEHFFMEQYMNLRNRYADALLTACVDREGTEKWLAGENVEVRGLAEGDTLMGVVILYPDKEGEIAFFVREPNSGIGTVLLAVIEEVARSNGLSYVKSWTLKDNAIAQRVFEKSGFFQMGKENREFRGTILAGIRYQKVLTDG